MSMLKDQLLNLEHQRFDAWRNRDIEKLAKLLDHDYLEINYFGRLSKKEVLDHLYPRLTVEEFVIEDPRIHCPSSESPILTYRCREKLTVDGQDTSGIFHVSAHFIEREDGWKLMLWQITPFADEIDNH